MEIAAQIARWHSADQVVEPNIHMRQETRWTVYAGDLRPAPMLVMLVDHNHFKAVSGDSPCVYRRQRSVR